MHAASVYQLLYSTSELQFAERALPELKMMMRSSIIELILGRHFPNGQLEGHCHLLLPADPCAVLVHHGMATLRCFR